MSAAQGSVVQSRRRSTWQRAARKLPNCAYQSRPQFLCICRLCCVADFTFVCVDYASEPRLAEHLPPASSWPPQHSFNNPYIRFFAFHFVTGIVCGGFNNIGYIEWCVRGLARTSKSSCRRQRAAAYGAGSIPRSVTAINTGPLLPESDVAWPKPVRGFDQFVCAVSARQPACSAE